MAELPEPAGGTHILEVLSWTLALTAAVTPISGGLVRFFYFQMAHVPWDNVQLAYSASVNQLIAAGMLTLLGPAFELIFLLQWRQMHRLIHLSRQVRLIRKDHKKFVDSLTLQTIELSQITPTDAEERRYVELRRHDIALSERQLRSMQDAINRVRHDMRTPLRFLWVTVIIYLIGAIVTVLFVPGFPISLGWAIIPFIGITAVVIAAHDSPVLRLRHILVGFLAALLPMTLTYAAGGGGPGLNTVEVHISSSASQFAPSGHYIIAGAADGTTMLLKCSAGRYRVVTVQSTMILSTTLVRQPPTTPSLWNHLTAGAPFHESWDGC